MTNKSTKAVKTPEPAYKQIKSYEDACADQGKDPAGLPDYTNAQPTPGEEKFNLAVFKLSRIAISLNKVDGKEWKPGANDLKYYPWMRIVPDGTKESGSGLSFRDYDCDVSDTYVASRLACRSSELAEYFFKQFQDLFEDMILFRE